MPPEILHVEQGSPEWFEARRGIPTASEFHTVLAKGKTPGSVSITRRTYLYKLAGEILTQEVQESYVNDHMERGKRMEAEARELYAFMTDESPELCGFIRNGFTGASPDSLIGANGMLEIKTKLPHVLIEECLFRDPGDPPPAHRAQCQGALWVAEREWIDLACYWPRMPLYVCRIHRDEAYIANLASEVQRFNDELAGIVARVLRYSNSGGMTSSPAAGVSSLSQALAASLALEESSNVK